MTDFPMFKLDADSGQIVAEHHPFTLPTAETVAFLEDEPLRVRGNLYDLVLNGVEIASGGLRIHKPELQRRILAILGHEDHQMERDFGFLLEALKYGAPPRRAGFRPRSPGHADGGSFHYQGCDSIAQDASGGCPLTGAPAIVDVRQLKELKSGNNGGCLLIAEPGS